MAERRDLMSQIGANKRRTVYLMVGFAVLITGAVVAFDLLFRFGAAFIVIAFVTSLPSVWSGRVTSIPTGWRSPPPELGRPIRTSSGSSTTWSRSCASASVSRSLASMSSTTRHRTRSRPGATLNTPRWRPLPACSK